MLTSETKRKIQSLRDILVGKIPTPTGQVEQITLALIFKFMSDIDTQHLTEFGAHTFFVGDYAKYHWKNLMDSKHSALERLTLYAEGLEKMNTNPHLNETFRHIFKGAFLPYRDPAILNLFLKGVNEIEYTHSEELGNAFEFLLSVMAAQGDAGQFRTPRHIIDFIVQVVDPQKDDTILDPACGTAGFLISAYKHILATNTDQKIGKPGSALTTKERQQLPQNITGYDVSHEMVRLSLANMFLHLFPNPQIYEYDTLGDNTRWNEEFSCVLANPPFMTPKGGIKPHKGFQIQANRAEVLFVDYIMEHLSTHGKAGIIVPEGIIFQSGTAYKALRKMMIEDNYLWAVVSLPSGVFQPYSGVKTSVLFFDRDIAKKSDSVYFVKIENDGFDLGAQRREIEKNDLPRAFEVLKDLKREILEGKDASVQEQSVVIKASKEAIRKDGDYSLSGDRYRDVEVRGVGKWPMLELGEICNLLGGGTPSKANDEFWKNGDIKWLSAKHIQKDNVIGYDLVTQEAVNNSSTNIAPKNSIIFVSRVSVGKITIADDHYAINQDITAFIPKDTNKLNYRFLFYTLREMAGTIASAAQGIGVKGVTRDYLKKLKLPLPPLHIQQQIVTELDRYQAIIDGARKVVDNWRPTLEVDNDWQIFKLVSIAQFKRGPFGGALKKEIFTKSGYKVYEQQHAIKNNFYIDKYFINQQKFEEMRDFEVKPNDLIVSCSGTMGKIAVAPKDLQEGIINQALLRLRPDTKQVLPYFLKYFLETSEIQTKYFRNTSGAGIPNVAPVTVLKDINVRLPSLEIQQDCLVRIEQENEYLKGFIKLSELYQEKITNVLKRLWTQ